MFCENFYDLYVTVMYFRVFNSEYINVNLFVNENLYVRQINCAT